MNTLEEDVRIVFESLMTMDDEEFDKLLKAEEGIGVPISFNKDQHDNSRIK